MAITSITVVQDNKVDSCLLLSVHNPLVFIVEVNYTATAPDILYVSDSVSSGIYSCVFHSDPQAGKRQFKFIAADIVRALMSDFDDVIQSGTTNIFRANKTLEITLTFYDPSTPATNVQIDFIAMTACRQHGESPSINELYENDNETYLGIVGFPCYCYFFNDNTANVITVSET